MSDVFTEEYMHNIYLNCSSWIYLYVVSGKYGSINYIYILYKSGQCPLRDLLHVKVEQTNIHFWHLNSLELSSWAFDDFKVRLCRNTFMRGSLTSITHLDSNRTNSLLVRGIIVTTIAIFLWKVGLHSRGCKRGMLNPFPISHCIDFGFKFILKIWIRFPCSGERGRWESQSLAHDVRLICSNIMWCHCCGGRSAHRLPFLTAVWVYHHAGTSPYWYINHRHEIMFIIYAWYVHHDYIPACNNYIYIYILSSWCRNRSP